MAKGKKVLTFKPGSDDFDEAELRKVAIGPSGNLRAPTLRTGKTWHVGFSDDAFGVSFS